MASVRLNVFQLQVRIARAEKLEKRIDPECLKRREAQHEAVF